MKESCCGIHAERADSLLGTSSIIQLELLHSAQFSVKFNLSSIHLNRKHKFNWKHFTTTTISLLNYSILFHSVQFSRYLFYSTHCNYHLMWDEKAVKLLFYSFSSLSTPWRIWCNHRSLPCHLPQKLIILAKEMRSCRSVRAQLSQSCIRCVLACRSTKFELELELEKSISPNISSSQWRPGTS